MAKYEIITNRLNNFFTNNKICTQSDKPTSGTWVKGDIVISSQPNSTAYGWVCITSGTPGVWITLKTADGIVLAWESIIGKPSSFPPEAHTHSANTVTIQDSENLFTSTNVEGALSELFTNVDNGKSSIAQAIIAKGVKSASKNDTFSELSTKILEIKSLPSESGWDNMRTGEVYGGVIKKDDPIAWKQYGNWDNTLNTVEHTMGADITWISSSAISGDGRFIALGYNQIPRLTVYRIDKDVPVKLPNPDSSVTEKPIFMKFSKNGKMLIGMTEAGRFFNYRIEDNTRLVELPKPKLLQTTNVAHATGKLDISNDGRLLAGEYKDYRGYTQRFIYERNSDDNDWVELYSISTSGLDEIYIPCIHPSNNFICFVYREKISIFFKRNSLGRFSDVRNNSYIYGSNFYWNTDGSLALATVKSTEISKIQLIKCDVNSTTNDYMTQDSTYTLSYNADFLCVNPDFSHFISLGTSTSFKIYKITMDNGEFGIIDTGKNIPFVSASTMERKVEFGGDYLLVSKGSSLDLYRTVSKDIVTPLAKVHNGTFKTCEVGFALSSGNVGEIIKVNTFPRMKL